MTMSLRPLPQPGLLTIATYVPGRAQAPAGVTPIKLSANESPLGASPKALEAARAALAKGFEIYPDGMSRALREAIGSVHGLDPNRIVCGNGSDDILHLLAQAYLGPGDEAVMSQYGFAVYPIVTKAAGAEIVVAPETDYRSDVDALLAAVTARTRVVFLANPNNPTGTLTSSAEIARLHAGLRSDILLVLDSAYAEYVTDPDYDGGIGLAKSQSNVVMVRTFSKMGLASLRTGWMFGPAEVVDAVNRIRNPFSVNVVGQVAAAAAVRDTEFTEQLRAHNARWRDWLSAELRSNRLIVPESQANFILVLFPDEDGLRAADAFEALFAQGLIVREVTSYDIPNGLRISIGSEAHMRQVADALKSFLTR